MITEFKLFESLEEVKLQNDLANAICDLYESENITVQNNFYDYTEDEPSYMFRILDFYKNYIIMDIEYFKSEPWINIHNYTNLNDNVNNFIKFVLNEFDEIWQDFGNNWSIDNFDLVNLPEVIEKLSVDNYIIWKDANKYNI
jgi:hypothetical protein